MSGRANKTQPVAISPQALIDAVDDDVRRADAQVLLSLFDTATGYPAVVWRGGMIGYGRYAYHYESGRSGTFFMTGFAPRKNHSAIYIMPGYDFPDIQQDLTRLGPHRHGKSCLYITRLSRIDLDVLEQIIDRGLSRLKARYQHWPR
jgi:hypothetical protein